MDQLLGHGDEILHKDVLIGRMGQVIGRTHKAAAKHPTRKQYRTGCTLHGMHFHRREDGETGGPWSAGMNSQHGRSWCGMSACTDFCIMQ
ncbi:MAG: hypothetical protein KKG10_04860, partial [Proteobacteria bacterium]|nr:hypothetical protein [Pseudomonadota bacterium]